MFLILRFWSFVEPSMVDAIEITSSAMLLKIKIKFIRA